MPAGARGGPGLASKAAIIVAILGLAGCVARPTDEVLKPVKLSEPAGQNLTVLTATNRAPHTGEPGFGNVWAAGFSYERYGISVPPRRNTTAINYADPHRPRPDEQYIVTAREGLSRKAFLASALQSVTADGTAGIFVHGYNYSYQEALFRVAQIGADARLPVAPILFSWPSAATVSGYVADRDAVLASRGDLNELVQMLSANRKVKRIVLFGHSMGSFLIMETVLALKLQGRDDIIDKLSIVLAAPDIDVDVFRAQLRDIGKMRTPITLLVSKVDRALSVSSLIGGERQRIGRMDINDPVIRSAAIEAGVRIVDITSVKGADGLGHDRYASLAAVGAEAIAREGRGDPQFAGTGASILSIPADFARASLREIRQASQ